MVADVTKLPIRFDGDRVAAFCRDRGIVRLSVFGSVLREDFDPTRSDIDGGSSRSFAVKPSRSTRGLKLENSNISNEGFIE